MKIHFSEFNLDHKERENIGVHYTVLLIMTKIQIYMLQ